VFWDFTAAAAIFGLLCDNGFMLVKGLATVLALRAFCLSVRTFVQNAKYMKLVSFRFFY
jgi:hypothetical protein